MFLSVFFSESVEQNIFVAHIQQYKEALSDFSARIWSSRSASRSQQRRVFIEVF